MPWVQRPTGKISPVDSCGSGWLVGCRYVINCLTHPVWLPTQHLLWPAAFRAAALEVLKAVHRRCARVEAGISSAMAQHIIRFLANNWDL